MSRFSGKCDLFDTMMMMHHRTKSGSDKPEDLEKASVLYSDEYECFLEFKKATNGTLYQHKKIEVTKYNQELVADKCKGFEIIELPLQEKQRKKRYSYKYYGKDYKDLKELNKKGVYITLEIHFKSMLDLIPYYPYTTSSICSNNEGMTIYISKQPFTLDERDDLLERGYDWQSMYEHYNKELQEHYAFVVQKYYTPKPENHIFELIKFDKNRQGKTKFPIDERFKIKWFFTDGDFKHPRWCQPKVIDYMNGIIEISQQDYDDYIGKECYVTYYKYEKPNLHLE